MYSKINFQEINRSMREGKIAELDEDQDFFAVSGKTGSGKSALLNFLLGFELSFEKKGLNYYLKHQNVSQVQASKRPAIGNSNKSCTESSSLYFDERNQAFYDLAGLFDTKGSTQQIINGLSISNIFQRGRRIKLILVIEINSLYEMRGSFINEFANLLKDQFGEDFEYLTNSMVMVISKVKTSEVQLQQIYEALREMINENTSISDHCRLMLGKIMKTKRIAMFPTPCKRFKEFIQQTKSVVRSLPPTMLSTNANLSLSANVKHSLIQFGHDTASKIKSISQELVKDMKVYFDRTQKSQFGKNMETLTKARDMMNSPMILDNAMLLAQVLGSLSITQKDIESLSSNLKILDFCQKSQNKKVSKSTLDTLSNGIQEIYLSYQSILQKQVSTEQKKQLQERLLRVEKQTEQRQQAEIQKIKDRQRRVQQELAKQKREMESQYQEVKRENERKIKLVEEQVRVQTENARRLEMEAEEFKKKAQQMRKQQQNGRLINQNQPQQPPSQFPQQYPQQYTPNYSQQNHQQYPSNLQYPSRQTNQHSSYGYQSHSQQQQPSQNRLRQEEKKPKYSYQEKNDEPKYHSREQNYNPYDQGPQNSLKPRQNTPQKRGQYQNGTQYPDNDKLQKDKNNLKNKLGGYKY